MIELSKDQIDRQDFVDNTVFEMIQILNPTNNLINWDIEMIGEIRDKINYWIVKHLEICSEQEFYPFIEIK